jgi:hypothetical protein
VRKLYVCGTQAGPIYIVIAEDGQFHPYFNGEILGTCSSPKQAVDEIAGGHRLAFAAGLDRAKLRIPNNLADWERC